MIKEFVADNELYLDNLSISIDEIPIINDCIDKSEFCKLVEKKFRSLVRERHPDYGGSTEEFKFLLKSKQVLVGESMKGGEFAFSVDYKKFQSYVKDSNAGIIGDQIFDLISSWSDELKIKPVLRPKTKEDEYEWVFNILDTDLKISINVQNLTQELAELSNSIHNEHSLPVLVCIFVPSKKLKIQTQEYDHSKVLTFNDLILIESSNSKAIFDYLSTIENIKSDINAIKNNNFCSNVSNEVKYKNVKDARRDDRKILTILERFKLFDPQNIEGAGDFIDEL